jgi:hypothetical protein
MLRSFTQRFANLYFQLLKVSDTWVVNAFSAGTTNQQVVEELIHSLGVTTVARLFQIAHENASRELGEDTSSEPSRQYRSPSRFRSKSPLWHPNGTRVPDASEEDSLARQD